jgi:hypothetical protein
MSFPPCRIMRYALAVLFLLAAWPTGYMTYAEDVVDHPPCLRGTWMQKVAEIVFNVNEKLTNSLDQIQDEVFVTSQEIFDISYIFQDDNGDDESMIGSTVDSVRNWLHYYAPYFDWDSNSAHKVIDPVILEDDQDEITLYSSLEAEGELSDKWIDDDDFMFGYTFGRDDDDDFGLFADEIDEIQILDNSNDEGTFYGYNDFFPTDTSYYYSNEGWYAQADEHYNEEHNLIEFGITRLAEERREDSQRKLSSNPLAPVPNNDIARGSCIVPGPECNPKDYVCTLEYQPVCGCDNSTHQNACVARYYDCNRCWTDGACSNSSASLIKVAQE